MYGKICILLFISYTCLVTADPVSFIKKCKWDDGKCNKESSQAALKIFAAGIPEYNVGVIDPLTIEYVDASSPNMKLIVTDVVVTGLFNCVMRFEDSSKIIVKLLCAAELKGKYDMKGQLFVIPIEGNGPLYAKVPKIQITAEVDLNVKSKDGTSTNELIAQNGNDVIIEIGSNLIKALVGKVVENIKNFFLAVPIKDLSL
ncbi:hypothetical protein SFRURICE_017072 [Spodoptera frugiperda]|nr:hypothetical protein SFRURICE_017072 [Spodoptera frugiperda]